MLPNFSTLFFLSCAFSLPVWQAYKTYSQLAAWENEGNTINSTLNTNYAITDSFIWCVSEFKMNLAVLCSGGCTFVQLLFDVLMRSCANPAALPLSYAFFLLPPWQGVGDAGHGGVAAGRRVVGRDGPQRPVWQSADHERNPMVRS